MIAISQSCFVLAARIAGFGCTATTGASFRAGWVARRGSIGLLLVRVDIDTTSSVASGFRSRLGTFVTPLQSTRVAPPRCHHAVRTGYQICKKNAAGAYARRQTCAPAPPTQLGPCVALATRVCRRHRGPACPRHHGEAVRESIGMNSPSSSPTAATPTARGRVNGTAAPRAGLPVLAGDGRLATTTNVREGAAAPRPQARIAPRAMPHVRQQARLAATRVRTATAVARIVARRARHAAETRAVAPRAVAPIRV